MVLQHAAVVVAQRERAARVHLVRVRRARVLQVVAQRGQQQRQHVNLKQLFAPYHRVAQKEVANLSHHEGVAEVICVGNAGQVLGQREHAVACRVHARKALSL